MNAQIQTLTKTVDVLAEEVKTLTALANQGKGSLRNLGAGALQRSTLRRKVNREEHADVPAELGKWVWAGGRKLKGLVKRRNSEALTYKANITV